MGRLDAIAEGGSFLSRLLRPRNVEVATHAATEGGAVARAERQAVAHEMTRPAPQGAGLPSANAPKAGPPRVVRQITAEGVTESATRPPRRPPVDLNPAVKPLSQGVKWAALGGAVGLAGVGVAAGARAIGDAVYHSHEQQLPYTHSLPGGGLLYTDPVTGETYVIQLHSDGTATHSDGTGPEGTGPNDTAGADYSVMPVTPGHRADAAAEKSIFGGLFNPWVLLGLVVLAALILVFAAKRKGAKGAA